MKRKLLSIFFAVAIAFSAVACSKEKVENANLKVITGIRAAFDVSKLQHDYAHITDEQYVVRLEKLRKTTIDANKFADLFKKYSQVTLTNKQEFFDAAREVSKDLDGLIADGSIGVKNPSRQADFRNGILIASVALDTIEVVIAAVDKPVNTSDLKVKKVEGL